MSGRDYFDAMMRLMRGYRPPSAPMVERFPHLSQREFASLRRQSRPFILNGVTGGGDEWSLARLRQRFADRMIAVIPIQAGKLVCDLRSGVAFETTRFGDYVDAIEQGGAPTAYMVTPGEPFLPELLEEIPPPEYCRDAAWRVSRFWLSGAQTSSPLHHDVADNLFFQLIGRKRFYLYPPAASAWLYSNPFRSALPNYSRFDPEHPDFEQFPLCSELRPLEVIVEPGDLLYLPSRWWHQVRSLEVCASFNYWFADGALALAVRAAEFVKDSRRLEIYSLARRVSAGSSTRPH